MPFVLSRAITGNEPAMWGEGSPHAKTSIYSIENCCGGPLVNYDAHLIKPHSLPHVDAPSHIIKNGMTIDQFFTADRLDTFYGRAVHIKVPVNVWTPCSVIPGNFVHRITLQELKVALERLSPDFIMVPPQRLLVDIVSGDISFSADGYDQKYALVLTEEAARWLISKQNFRFYGVAYKSTDYNPAGPERPIHELLFSTGVVSECLTLHHVPEGEYFLVAMPLPLQGASESPVCPILFRPEELKLR